MPFNQRLLKVDQKLNPISQYFNPTADDYEPVLGAYGASRTIIYDSLGNPLSTVGNPAVVTIASKGAGQTPKTWTGYDITTTVAVANPTAVPTLATATTGGSLPAATYYVVYTWKNANGETLVSPEANIVTTGAVSTITVTVPALPSGATLTNVYIGTSAGTGTLQGNTATASYVQSAALVAGAARPTAVTINTVVQVLSTVTTGKTLWVTDRSFTNSTATKTLVTLNASAVAGVAPIESYYVGDAPLDDPNSGTKNSIAGGATFTLQIRCIATVIMIAMNIRGYEQ